jgi:tRNA-guanine transglycosylase
MTAKFQFHLKATDGKARTGVIETPRGEIRTPAFMPVGTAATVKAMMPESVAATGADILLGNTYHLMLRPTAERIDRLGGLHKFMNWDKPILTDSGGFQVMSLADLRKLTERGVTFKSHIDGSKHELTPERSMEIQKLLGSDIVMCFDECPALPADEARVAESMRLSMRWAQRSRDAFGDRPGHALFGIQQGGVTESLRAESAEALTRIGFDGYAVGGLAVGEGQEAMFGVLDYAPDMLPTDKPRYLMGVGKPDDIVGAVARGMIVAVVIAFGAWIFLGVGIAHPLWTLAFVLAGSVFMGALGIVAAIFANKFDQLSAISNFVVTPLSFLSGTFYSITALPTPLQAMSHANPFFYIIDGVRFGMIGVSDRAPALGLAIASGAALAILVLCWRWFRMGYRLKP